MKEFVIWDFDGVIIESDKIRENGFREALKEFDNREVEKLISYHRKNGGLSRYHKFEYFFNQINLEKHLCNKYTNNALKVFGDLMKKSLCNPSLLIKENLNKIEHLSKKSKMYIASGSDHIELNEICRCLDLDKYFLGIYGSPTPKKQIVRELLKNSNSTVKNWVLIGDSINDYEAALDSNIDFIGYGDNKIINLSTMSFDDVI